MRASLFSPERDNHHSMCKKFLKYLQKLPDLNLTKENDTFKHLCAFVETRDRGEFISLQVLLKIDPANIGQFFHNLRSDDLREELYQTFAVFKGLCLDYEEIAPEELHQASSSTP